MMDSGCSLETLYGVFCLLIGDKVWGGLLSLEVVWGLFLHINVFDCSLFTILIVWSLSAYLWKVSKSPAIVALLIRGLAFFSCPVGPWATVSTCSLGTMPVVSRGAGSSHAASVAGSPASEWASVASSALKFVLAHACGHWVIWCIGVLSVQSTDSGQRACTCLHVASSVWHILMQSCRVRLEPFEIHCCKL